MTSITTKAMAKVAVVATGLAMATSMLSLAPIAHAACDVGMVNLTTGSSGSAVICLQQSLIAAGYSIPAGATGYFGAQTKAAVAMWQKAAGVAPAVGYFGPISRAAWNLAMSGGSTGGSTGGSSSSGCLPGYMFNPVTGAACGSTPSTGGSLSGTGRLTNLSSYGSVTSDLKEGDAATAVVGVQADATGGDVSVQRVDATFYVDDVGSQSSSLNQYASDVSVWLNGTKLASMDPSMGDKSGRVWTMRFSGLNGVIKSGTTGNIVVKVTPLSSIGTNEDSSSTSHPIVAAILQNGIRAVGGDGISDTYVSGSSFNTNISSPTSATGYSNSFTISSATNGTLTVSAAADNPKASQIAVSSSTTTGVKLLSFTMKAKNQSVKVTDLAAQLVTSDNNLSDVVNTLYLMKNGQVLKSTTLSTGTAGTVTFSNVNDTIAKDQTNTYSLVADLKGDSAYADGTTLIASTTVSGWDVSDANGSSVTPSAAALGNTMTLTATGISVVRGTVSNTVATGLAGAGDIATMVIPFTVTAGDTDIYIAGSAQKSSGNVANKVTYSTTTTSTAGATGEPTANLSVGDTVSGDSAGSYYKVSAGTSRTFTLTVAITATTTGATTAGFVGAQINSIAYGTVAGTESSFYTSNLDTFKTDDKYVTKR